MPSPNRSPNIAIACAANAHYALPLAVMLRSLYENLEKPEHCQVYIVDDGIGSTLRDKIEIGLPDTVNLNWIQQSGETFEKLPNWGRMALTTYHKLTIAEWLPDDLERVIWIDCDTLVLANVETLWNQSFEGNVALAVQDVLVPCAASRFGIAGYEEFGIEPDTPYFNAGILLLDLRSWREHSIGSIAWKYLKDFYQKIYFWDQEALNAALAGRWKKIDSRWNWNPLMNRFIRGSSFPENPAILHFTGNLKPWNYFCVGHYYDLYYDYLDRTAWCGFRPPQTLRGALVARYSVSRVRALFYPLEKIQMCLVRWWTRR